MLTPSGGHAHSPHTNLRLSAQAIPSTHDSSETEQLFIFSVVGPSDLIHARSWPFVWHPAGVAGRGQMCSGCVARRRRSTSLAIISRLNPTEDAALTSRWSSHQAWRSRQQVVKIGDGWWRSQLGAGNWVYWYLWIGRAATLMSRNNQMSPLTFAISLVLLDTLKGLNDSTQIVPRPNIFPVRIKLISCFHGHGEKEGDGEAHYVRCYESETPIRALQHASATHSFARRSQRWQWVYRQTNICSDCFRQCLCRNDVVFLWHNGKTIMLHSQ